MAKTPVDENIDVTTKFNRDAGSASRAEEFRPGYIFANKFELQCKLGEGAFGEVWKARDIKLRFKVAIKILRTQKAEDLERFRREAQALCLIDSEFVLRCREYNEEPIPFLVMELLTGESLAKRLEREKPMPLSTVKAICQQLCRGLRATHAAGVIHRDLKPANIYCVGSKVKIVDFGLTKFVDPLEEPETELIVSENNELTGAHTVMGTLNYMSPEQLCKTKHVDFKADLWSLAVVLYRLLSGNYPFPSNSFSQLVLKLIASSDPPPPIFDVPPEVNTFFATAFQRDEKLRFQSAEELGNAFESLGNPTITIVSEPELPAPPPAPSRRLLVVAGALVVLGLAGSIATVQAKPEILPGCGDGKANCDGALLNGCESDLASASSCGACGVHCSNPHGATSCAAGSCSPVCEAGHADCDGNSANGCEASLGSPDHCGRCGAICTNPHGSAACSLGQCVLTCQPGFLDCDSDPGNGCETDVLSSSVHCGSCGSGCGTLAGNAASCQAGVCKLSCPPGRHDCNGNPVDGCEVDASAAPGAFENGRCTPVVLSVYLAGASSIATDDATDGILAWTLPSRGEVWRMRKSGGEAALMSAGGSPTRILFDSGNWYWTDTSQNGVYTLDAVSGRRRRVIGLPDPARRISGIASWGDKVFFFYHDKLNDRGELFSGKKDDGRLLEYENASFNPFGLAMDNSYLYFSRTSSDGSIWGYSLKDQKEQRLVADHQGTLVSLAVARRRDLVVWASQREDEHGQPLPYGGSIAVARLGGEVSVIAPREHAPRGLAVDATWAYWTNEMGEIKKSRLDEPGGAVLLASGQGRPTGIAVDDTRVYWVNERSGEVMALAK